MKHSITLNADGHYGVASYDEETKEYTISIPGAAEAEQRVLAFLAKPLTMDIPTDNIREFQTVTLLAQDSVENFRWVLTRLWVDTKVLVEWSMPPALVDK